MVREDQERDGVAVDKESLIKVAERYLDEPVPTEPALFSEWAKDVRKLVEQLIEVAELTEVTIYTKDETEAKKEYFEQITQYVRDHPGLQIRDIVRAVGHGPYKDVKSAANVCKNRLGDACLPIRRVEKGPKMILLYPMDTE